MINGEYEILNDTNNEDIRDYIESNEANNYLSSCEFHDLKYV